MLLAVPLTMTVKIALQASEETRWLAILLGSRSSAEVEAKADA
jgi:predicted PurR-regulated permease PerM